MPSANSHYHVPVATAREQEIVTALKVQKPESSDWLKIELEGGGFSLQKAQRKERHDYPDIELDKDEGVLQSRRRRGRYISSE